MPILLSSLLGGIFIVLGVGIMLRQHVSYGAIDLLARLISKYFIINPGIVILFVDLFIIILGVIVFQDEKRALFTVSSVGLLSGLLT